MVAHFHSKATFRVRDTFSTYRDGRFFDRYCSEIWWAWRTLCHRTFISLLVQWSSTTNRISGTGIRFWTLGWLHTKIYFTWQNWSANMWTSGLRKKVDNFCLEDTKWWCFRRNTLCFPAITEAGEPRSYLSWAVTLTDLVGVGFESKRVLFKRLAKQFWGRTWLGSLSSEGARI